MLFFFFVCFLWR